jgi:hypothetical protein
VIKLIWKNFGFGGKRRKGKYRKEKIGKRRKSNCSVLLIISTIKNTLFYQLQQKRRPETNNKLKRI